MGNVPIFLHLLVGKPLISHGFPQWIFPKDLMSQLERLEELRPGTAKRLKARSANVNDIPP